MNIKNLLLQSILNAFVAVTIVYTAYGFAAYDRHDGSQFSCNEINADRYYAKTHDQPAAFKAFDAEYKKFCSSRND